MDDRKIHPNEGTSVATTNESRLQLLIDTGLLLASERSLDVIVQAALDAGLKLSGAAFGAFFYNKLDGDGETYQLFKVSGIEERLLQAYPLTRRSAASGPAVPEDTIVRSDDITTDPRYGQSSPLNGVSVPPLPMRSCLSVPVRSRGGEALGTLLYGHPEPGVFPEKVESLVATVAAQAAVAIDNARLNETLTHEITLADAARADQRTTGRRLRQALDAANLGTWSWDAQTGMLDLDERAAALFGVDPHVPVSRAALRERIVHREDIGMTPEDLREILKSGGQYSAEYRIEATDGTQRWVAANGNASMADDSGEIAGMTGTVQDITLRKTQEASLRTNEKLAATGRLAAVIAHEINNPLEAVTNLIYLAKTDAATPGSVVRLLETADTELARVAQLAQQTLGFYRDTRRPAAIDINGLVQAVVDLFGRKLAGKRLQCLVDMEPGLSVLGLQGEIRQVISNLLVNAIDASPTTGGNIRIRGRRRSREGKRGVSVMIADEGSGIPEQVRKHLFTPFVTTKQSLGTGLGLWVTHSMVEKHGGSVRFRTSTRHPSGTVFRMYLPETGDPQLFAPPSSAVLQ